MPVRDMIERSRAAARERAERARGESEVKVVVTMRDKDGTEQIWRSVVRSDFMLKMSGPPDVVKCGRCGAEFPSGTAHSCETRVRATVEPSKPGRPVLNASDAFTKEQWAGLQRGENVLMCPQPGGES